jgi:hypothetical protein
MKDGKSDISSGEEMAIDVPVAAKRIGLSLSFLYKLDDSTPGLYRFGKKKKINVAELMAWARKCSMERAAGKSAAPKGKNVG